jgi:hypothetical protein
MISKDSGIKIILNDSQKEGIDVDDSMLQSSFVACIVGPPGSGKSTLIETLITHEKLLFKKFDQILFITPSKFRNIPLDEEINWYPRLNVGWLTKKLEEQSIIGNRTKEIQQVLIVFDDVVSELKGIAELDFLTKLFYNRRHLISNVFINIILVTQKYNMIPLKFRAVITMLFIFKLSKSQWSDILKEITIRISPHTLRSLEALFKNNHDFLLINTLNESVYYNFNKLLL